MEVSVNFFFFGSRFIREEVAIPIYHRRPMISLEVATRFLSCGTNEFIEEDMRLFKTSFKTVTTKGKMGFRRVNGNTYVFQFTMHAAMNSVVPAELVSWGINVEKPKQKGISVCTSHLFHDFLLPFVYENTTLLMKYKEIETAEDAERKEANKVYHDMLKSIKDKGGGHVHTPFHCMGFPFRGGAYDEVEWTIRLFHCVKDHLPLDYQIHLTYDNGLTFALLQEQYSKCGDTGYYLFQGAPEITLFPHSVVGGGASVVVNEEVNVVEIKRNDPRHTRSSTVPHEAGQVIATLHFFAVARMLSAIMAGTDPLPSSVQTKGLVISRNSNIMLFILNQVVTGIDEVGDTVVKIVDLKCTGSREEFVCTALGYLCNPSTFTINDL